MVCSGAGKEFSRRRSRGRGIPEEPQWFGTFISTGLWAPTELDAVPRTIFDNDRTKNFYDQIAWFSEPDGTSLLQGLTYGQRAGSFDFIPPVYQGLSRNEVSWRISDHYALWCEFLLD